MADNNNKRDIRTLVSQFRTSDHWAVSLARDLLWIVAVVGGIALALFLICGTWPAVVTIESQSMVPHMNVGDLVIVVQKDRYGSFETWVEGKNSGKMMFGDYGDVIIYKPNGLTTIHPIIHRAIQYVDTNPVTEIKGIKQEWIVGKALFSIPLVGYLPLHILEVTIVIVGLMVIHELYLRSRQDKQGKQPKKGGKKQR
jgi:signal peptidase